MHILHFICAVDEMAIEESDDRNDQPQNDSIATEVTTTSADVSAVVAATPSKVNCKAHYSFDKRMSSSAKYAKQFHEQKMKHLKEEHELKMKILNMELEIKELEYRHAGTSLSLM